MDQLIATLKDWGINLQTWLGERTDVEIITMLVGSVLLFPFVFFILSWILHLRIEPLDVWLTRHLDALNLAWRRYRKHRK
jgi:hypothetical protein